MAVCNTDFEETFFHCSICTELFTEPKILQCLHSFCKLCLKSYITSNVTRFGKRTGFLCPLCRKFQESSDPRKTLEYWADDLTTNFNLVSMMETLPLNEGKCSIHEKPIEFFCQNHTIGICSNCAVFDHKPCEIISIDSKEDNFEQTVEEFYRKLTNATEIKNKLELYIQKLQSDQSSIRSQIIDENKIIRRKLAELERKMMDDLEKVCKRQFETTKEKLAKYDNAVAIAHRVIDNILSSDSRSIDTITTAGKTLDSELYKLLDGVDVGGGIILVMNSDFKRYLLQTTKLGQVYVNKSESSGNPWSVRVQPSSVMRQMVFNVSEVRKPSRSLQTSTTENKDTLETECTNIQDELEERPPPYSAIVRTRRFSSGITQPPSSPSYQREEAVSPFTTSTEPNLARYSVKNSRISSIGVPQSPSSPPNQRVEIASPLAIFTEPSLADCSVQSSRRYSIDVPQPSSSPPNQRAEIASPSAISTESSLADYSVHYSQREAVEPPYSTAYISPLQGKTSTDKHNCYFNGACFLENGHIALTDRKNKKLKLFSASFELVAEKNLECKPFDVLQTREGYIATTISKKCQVQFFSIELVQKLSIDTKQPCRGISEADNNLYVFCEDAVRSEGCIKVYDERQHIVSVIIRDESGRMLFWNTDYITVCPNSRSIYFNRGYLGKCTIFCIDFNGNVKWKSKAPSWGDSPHGMDVVDGGLVVAAGSVKCISQNGTKWKKLIEIPESVNPRTLAINNDKSMLLVTYADSISSSAENNQVRIFRLKYRTL